LEKFSVAQEKEKEAKSSKENKEKVAEISSADTAEEKSSAGDSVQPTKIDDMKEHDDQHQSETATGNPGKISGGWN
jgi:hypothetical protein